MIIKRSRDTRGQTETGWLSSMHNFSFGHYQDPKQMGFSALRVINEDHVIPKAGFGMHGHSNMEIISYVLKGELAHKDSMGNGSIIRPGEVQIMSAGSGVKHSEFNASDKDDLHFLQIWILPNVENEDPTYQQKPFMSDASKNNLKMVASPDGQNGSLTIKQNAWMFSGQFDMDQKAEFKPSKGRKYWVQIAKGIVDLNGQNGDNGDGFAIENEDLVTVKAITPFEILVFDLP